MPAIRAFNPFAAAVAVDEATLVLSDKGSARIEVAAEGEPLKSSPRAQRSIFSLSFANKASKPTAKPLVRVDSHTSTPSQHPQPPVNAWDGRKIGM